MKEASDMTEERKSICVTCPVGCGLTVTMEDGEIVSVEGNACPRGELYAKAEVADPRRVFASTVRARGAPLPVCPVRSAAPVPKGKLFDIAREVARVEVEAPISIGQTIVRDVCGTGVDIVASRDMERDESARA